MTEEIKFPCKMVMTNEAYHESSAIGSSDLKLILKSPAHYKYEKENPSDPTPAMQFGTACHQALLEPKLFAEAVERPVFEGKGSRAAKEEWILAHHGKLILKSDEFDTIRGMLVAISKHKTARGLLAGGEPESAYFWQDDQTGLICKCKPDFLRNGGIVVDIKTTQDASSASFQRDITNYKYHLSAFHYLAGVTAVTGIKHDTFLIIAVEKEPPFGVQVFELDRPSLDKGGELRNRALLRLKACKDSGIYPNYTEEIVPMNLAPWGWTE